MNINKWVFILSPILNGYFVSMGWSEGQICLLYWPNKFRNPYLNHSIREINQHYFHFYSITQGSPTPGLQLTTGLRPVWNWTMQACAWVYTHNSTRLCSGCLPYTATLKCMNLALCARVCASATQMEPSPLPPPHAWPPRREGWGLLV